MRGLRYTLAGLAVAVILFIAAGVYDLDLAETAWRWLNSYEHHELDELLTALVPVIIGFAVDLNTALKKRKKDKLKLATLRSTMNSVDHIVNNAHQIISHSVYLAEEQGKIDQDIAIKIQEVIADAQSSLDEIRTVDSVKEKELAPGFFLVDADKRAE